MPVRELSRLNRRRAPQAGPDKALRAITALQGERSGTLVLVFERLHRGGGDRRRDHRRQHVDQTFVEYGTQSARGRSRSLLKAALTSLYATASA